MNPAGNLTYDVFVNDPPPQDGLLPNGEPKLFSPMASTLIYGTDDAVLTDPGMTADQARVLGDWVAARGRLSRAFGARTRHAAWMMSVATSSAAFQRGPGQHRGVGVRGLDMGARASLLCIYRCPHTQ